MIMGLDEKLDEILHDFLWDETIEIKEAIQAIKEAICENGCNTIQKIKIIPNSAMFLVREFYIEIPCIYCGKEI